MKTNLTNLRSALLLLALLAMPAAWAQTAELVEDIYQGTGSSSPVYLTKVGNEIFFRAYTQQYGEELWKTSGPNNTSLVADIYNGSGSPGMSPRISPSYYQGERFAQANGYIYFYARDQSREYEVWRSNGNGAQRVTSLYCCNADPHYFFEGPNNRVYFNARRSGSDYNLYYMSGTNYTQCGNIRSGSNPSPRNYCTVGTRTYFSARNCCDGYELWYIDGNSNSPQYVRDIRSGSSSSSPTYLAPLSNNRIVFSTHHDTYGRELWISDGTSGGTQLVKDMYNGSSSSDPAYLTPLPNGDVVFRANDGTNGYELWITDGTSNGTRMLKDINPAGGSEPQYFTLVGDKVFFRCYTPAYGWEVWETDGTEAGTKLVHDVSAGPNSSSPEWLTDINGALYFTADTPNEGRELYKVLPAGGAKLVADVRAGPNSSSPQYLVYLNGYCYFNADDGRFGREIFRVAIPPEVVEVEPAINANDAQADTDITITNSQAVTTASVDGTSFHTHAQFTGKLSGQFSVSQMDAVFDPANNLQPGEIVEVTVTGEFENNFMLTSGTPYSFRFRVSSGVGPAQFDSVLLSNIGSGMAKANAVAAGDLDGDGANDLVLALSGGQNLIAWNNGTGGFGNVTPFGDAMGDTTDVKLADLDADGSLDIAVVNDGGENAVFLNDGQGNFSNRVPFGPSNDFSTALEIGDIDGDGALDLVVANFVQQNLVLFNDGSGAFQRVTSFGTGTDDTLDVAIGDINGDGKFDIIVANQLNPSRYYVNVNGTFDPLITARDFGAGVSFSSAVATADLDNDGDLDIVTANLNRKNTVFWNTGGGEFNGMPLEFPNFDPSRDVMITDIDGDDYLDLAFANDGGQNEVFLNDQAGSFATATPINFGSGADETQGLAFADLDGDGDMDLVLANENGSSTVAPNAVSQPTAPQILSTAPSMVTVGTRYEYNVLASGVPAPTITVSGEPAWLTLNGNVLSGTPTANDLGPTSTITIEATNAIGTPAIEQFTITVNPAPSAPSFTSQPVLNAAVGAAFSYSPTADGFPMPTISASNLPAWLSFTGGSLVGTPQANHIGTTQTITLTATNGVGADATQSFEIVVSFEEAPQITSQPVLTATVGVQYTYSITASGAPAPTITATNLPSWLTLNGNVLSGIPNPSDASPNGIGTTPEITITAMNGVGTDAAQSFEITVTDPAQLSAPQIVSVPVTVANVGEEYVYQIAAAGSPAPEVMVNGLPSWLSYDSATNLISGTPMSTDVGLTGTITVSAENSLSQSTNQSFQLIVLGVPASVSSEESTCALIDGNGSWSACLIVLAGLSVALGLRRREEY